MSVYVVIAHGQVNKGHFRGMMRLHKEYSGDNFFSKIVVRTAGNRARANTTIAAQNYKILLNFLQTNITKNINPFKQTNREFC